MSNHSPACSCTVLERDINDHLDSGCSEHKATQNTESQSQPNFKGESKGKLAPIFSQGYGSNLKPSGMSTISSEMVSEGPSKKKRKAEVSSKLAMSQPVFGGQKLTNKRAFDATAKINIPLAERFRPQSLEEFVGQDHLTGPHSLLRNLLESGNLGSIIFWGPPG